MTLQPTPIKANDGSDSKKFNVPVESERENSCQRMFSCNICEKQFRRKASLTIHLNSHNPKTNTGDCHQAGEKESENVCSICYKKFTAKKNLLKHLRDVHKNFKEAERMVVKKIKCPEAKCSFLCRMMKELRDHIEGVHKVKILKDTLEFPNETVFQKWKKEEETNTVSWFVTGRKKTTLMDGTKKQILYCHRTGHYSPKGFGKYRMRSVGSCKIGVTCPASMEVVESADGHLSVVYYKTHLGHVQDVVYLKLSREERAHLAEKIEQGFTFDSILEGVKEDIDKSNLKTKRIHLLSKKDLYSIMRSSHCSQEKKRKKGLQNKELESLINKDKEVGRDELVVEGVEERFDNNVQPNLTLYPGEGVILPEEYSIGNGHLMTKTPREISGLPQSATDRISPQIVIFSRDIDCTSVAEIILLSAEGTVVPAKIVTESGSETAKDVSVGLALPSPSEEKKKSNKLDLKGRLKEKLDRIYELLPQSEFLTPKQFELVGDKLDVVLNMFVTADAKAKLKANSKRKTPKREKVGVQSGEINQGIG